jgi:hypothetical protein
MKTIKDKNKPQLQQTEVLSDIKDKIWLMSDAVDSIYALEDDG